MRQQPHGHSLKQTRSADASKKQDASSVMLSWPLPRLASPSAEQTAVKKNRAASVKKKPPPSTPKVTPSSELPPTV